MTRSIFVFVLGALLALTSITQADPSPAPTTSVKRKFNGHSDHFIVGKPHATPAPTPKGKFHAFTGGHEVQRAPMTSRPGSSDGMPGPASPRVIMSSSGGSGRIVTPNEYSEPDSPAAGPNFRSTGSPPVVLQRKFQSDIVASSAMRKVASKILIPPLSKNSASQDANAEMNIDANPPTPSELGAPIVIPMIPRYDAVPRSKAFYLPEGNAPIPVDYAPPVSDAPAEISPTSLRAWNGEVTRETRTFDQTRVQVTTGADGARRWQFFWRTSGAKPRAARWEISTVPFVDDANNFPPAGLVAYGDASVSAQSPAMENFFAVEFNSLTKNFGNASTPSQLYLRVVPVDGAGKPAAQPSNWVRVDIR